MLVSSLFKYSYSYATISFNFVPQASHFQFLILHKRPYLWIKFNTADRLSDFPLVNNWMTLGCICIWGCGGEGVWKLYLWVSRFLYLKREESVKNCATKKKVSKMSDSTFVAVVMCKFTRVVFWLSTKPWGYYCQVWQACILYSI